MAFLTSFSPRACRSFASDSVCRGQARASAAPRFARPRGDKSRIAPRIELYAVRYRDLRIWKCIRARYVATCEEITQRYSEWEIARPKSENQGAAYQGAVAVSPRVHVTDKGLALELTSKGTKYYKELNIG